LSKKEQRGFAKLRRQNSPENNKAATETGKGGASSIHSEEK